MGEPEELLAVYGCKRSFCGPCNHGHLSALLPNGRAYISPPFFSQSQGVEFLIHCFLRGVYSLATTQELLQELAALGLPMDTTPHDEPPSQRDLARFFK